MMQARRVEPLEEAVPVMLWRARPDLSCEYLSRKWLDFTGYSAEQALGDGWSRGVHPEDLARWLDVYVRAFDAREPFEIEYRLRRRDGEYRWVLDRAEPRYGSDGTFLGFVGTCIDINERKRAERELAASLERERRLRAASEDASRLKDGFLAELLHNLRAPAQAIAAWAARLREQEPGSSAAAQALEAIEHNARAQERILVSLLELDRLAGKPLPARGTAALPLLGGVRVLIVDDDPAARETMAKVLGLAGAETRAARSLDEAVATLGAFRPDVVLSDAADGTRAVAAGCNAQLAKPVEPVALLATVARLAQQPGV
jgi:PAS domain S-box-containing protein